MRRRGGVRVRFGGLAMNRRGWIVAAVLLLLSAGVCAGLFSIARDFLLHDERFVIASSSAIEFQGDAHVTREQLLSVFGGDIERNSFKVPLAQRRAEVEQMPWVAHATVMRLLPNRLRVSVVERTPVAFVRQGNHIGLVDASGVLLTMAQTKSEAHYSFPVVTGISANDPLSTRAARMKIFDRFTSDLDSSGEKISERLSEVDLSNPEDVKALIPDHATEVLVHFGDAAFLDRYRRFETHLPEWRTVYPKLSSVDMRYERQVVLEMQPGSGVPSPSPPSSPSPTSSTSAERSASPVAAGRSANSAAPKPEKARALSIPRAVHPAAKHLIGAKARPATKTPVHGKSHSGVAKKSAVKGKAHPGTPKHPPVVVRHAAGETLYHPPQVTHQVTSQGIHR